MGAFVRLAVTRLALAVLAAGLFISPTAGASFPGANGDIAVVSTTLHRLAGTCEASATQDCSPDDPHLALRRSLAFLAPSGGVRREVAVAPSAGSFAGSPDGRRLAYTRAGGVWISDLDGGHRRSVVASGTTPAWAPDGRHIAFTDRRGIWVVGTDGRGKRRLTTGFRDSRPQWSPGGRTIAFVRETRLPSGTPCVSASEIYAIGSGGGSARRLYDPGFRCADVYSLDWSPHGSKLVVSAFDATTGSKEPDPRAAALAGITTVRPDGTGRRRVIDGGLAAVWSPDATRIAYVDPRCRSATDPFVPGTQVCAARPDGSGIRAIGLVRDDIGSLYPPVWLVR